MDIADEIMDEYRDTLATLAQLTAPMTKG